MIAVMVRIVRRCSGEECMVFGGDERAFTVLTMADYWPEWQFVGIHVEIIIVLAVHFCLGLFFVCVLYFTNEKLKNLLYLHSKEDTNVWSRPACKTLLGVCVCVCVSGTKGQSLVPWYCIWSHFSLHLSVEAL